MRRGISEVYDKNLVFESKFWIYRSCPMCRSEAKAERTTAGTATHCSKCCSEAEAFWTTSCYANFWVVNNLNLCVM